MAYKILSNTEIQGGLKVTAMPAAAGTTKAVVWNEDTKEFMISDGGGGLPAGCQAICFTVRGTFSGSGGSGNNWMYYEIMPDPIPVDFDPEEVMIVGNSVASGTEETPWFTLDPAQNHRTGNVWGCMFWKTDSPGSAYSSDGNALGMVLISNNFIYAMRSIDPQEIEDAANDFGEIRFPADYGPLGEWTGFSMPRGDVHMLMFSASNDTNNQDAGMVAVHGPQKLNATLFTVSALPQGISGQDRVMSDVDLAVPQEMLYFLGSFGSSATSMNIVIETPTNGEGITLEVNFVASVDTGLNFTETIAPGAAYNRTVPVTLAQAAANDFLITIQPA